MTSEHPQNLHLVGLGSLSTVVDGCRGDVGLLNMYSSSGQGVGLLGICILAARVLLQKFQLAQFRYFS